jgi:hypothetical protein
MGGSARLKPGPLFFSNPLTAISPHQNASSPQFPPTKTSPMALGAMVILVCARICLGYRHIKTIWLPLIFYLSWILFTSHANFSIGQRN